MYVEFTGGYIAPCEVLKEIPGWARVLLRPLPPNEHLSWRQWVRKSQLIRPEDITED